MKKRFIMVGILLLFFFQLKAQEKYFSISDDEKIMMSSEVQRNQKLMNPVNTSSVASEWLDITYYKLDLSILTAPSLLRGCVTIKGFCRQISDTILVLDLKNTMHIDSIHLNGAINNFYQDTSSFGIKLGYPYSVGDQLTVDVFYGGLPFGTGFGSFMFDEHSGIPWIWSLSEPYGARDWWPCKDHPSDKADSADVIITCDSSFKVGSNGKLVLVNNNGNGTKTYYWHERYPIATYLISVAISNFEQFSNWFHYSTTDSMEVLNYVLPEHLTSAIENLPLTIGMLKIFSDLFGLYPFINEKYGHSDFKRGGAMEHQTMTSTTTYSEPVIAHELAHQWFGDMITCRTWSDLWLNEGFAQYSTALYLEKKYGEASYRNYMKNQLSNARLAVGSVYVSDTSIVRNLFDGNLVYSKGASVLHMLRHVLRDSIFFRSMYEYANSPSLRYGNASGADFRSVCERVSGIELGYFFDEWIYGENFPHYSFGWNVDNTQSQHTIAVTIKQIMNTSNPMFFTMPIDLQLIGERWDTTVTVFNNSQEQIFSIPVGRTIRQVQLDPGEWLLRNIFEDIHPDFSLNQNYPNPFNRSTWIDYHIPDRTRVKLVVYNLLGQVVATLVDEVKTMGNYTAFWNASSLPVGVYFYRLQTSKLQVTRKMVLTSSE
jgi:aminopeptidase N